MAFLLLLYIVVYIRVSNALGFRIASPDLVKMSIYGWSGFSRLRNCIHLVAADLWFK